MRREDRLWFRRSPRCEQEKCRIVGPGLHRRRAGALGPGEIRPGVYTTGRLGAAQHDLCAERFPVPAQPLESLGIEDQRARLDLGAHIEEFVVQAEAVYRCRHGTRQCRTQECHGPFRTIAHGNGHPVTLPDAELLAQAPGQRIRLGKHPRVSPGLALIEDEGVFTVDARRVEKFGQRRRRMAVCRVLLPAHLDFGQLERRAGRGQLLAQAGERAGNVIHQNLRNFA